MNKQLTSKYKKKEQDKENCVRRKSFFPFYSFLKTNKTKNRTKNMTKNKTKKIV